MRLTREITVTVSSGEIIKFFTDILYAKSKLLAGVNINTTMYHVLGNLTGCSDVEAVKLANRWADDHNCPHIKVAEFRRWLPSVLSEVFAEHLGKTQGCDPR